MHYIRLLRPVEVLPTSDGTVHFLNVRLTITTDLGDAPYAPKTPLKVNFDIEHAKKWTRLKDIFEAGPWKAGQHVLRVKLRAPIPKLFQGPGPAILHISATRQATCTDVEYPFWSYSYQDPPMEPIVPCNYILHKDSPLDHSFRELPLSVGGSLTFEEALGESIARHLWDAGLITASFIGDMCCQKKTMSRMLPIASDKKHIKVLELGCGIGVLGITVAAVLHQIAKVQGCKDPTMEVLLTDVDDAKARASSNIATAAERIHRGGEESNVKLAYETLDWNHGQHGQFGPLASQQWDFVILSDCTYNVDSFPALVGTLNAVHAQNCKLAQSVVRTRVLLATKPRHKSEDMLFGKLDRQGWKCRIIQSIPLIREDWGEDEKVDIYMIEKETSAPFWPAKRKIWDRPTEVATAEGEAETTTSATESAPPTKSEVEAGAAGADVPPTESAPSSPTKRKAPGQSTEGATAGNGAGVISSTSKKART